MLSSSILSSISDGMAIVSDAIRNVNLAMNGQPATQAGYWGYCNNAGVDMNTSRRDLPCYQTPMYNPGIPNQYYTNPSVTNPVYGYPNNPYSVPIMNIPGKTDPSYGLAPSICDNRGPMNYKGNPFVTQNTGSMTTGYFSLPNYTSPFMVNNGIAPLYGYPYGGKYGY